MKRCHNKRHNRNIVILLNFKEKRLKAFFLDNLPTDAGLQTVWVLQILLIPINLLSFASDSFFNAIWP